MPIEPSEEPLKFYAEKGFVLIEGASGVTLTLTHRAAIDSIDGLIRASTTAHHQASGAPADSDHC